jgi:hypothetical protein
VSGVGTGLLVSAALDERFENSLVRRREMIEVRERHCHPMPAHDRACLRLAQLANEQRSRPPLPGSGLTCAFRIDG